MRRLLLATNHQVYSLLEVTSQKNGGEGGAISPPSPKGTKKRLKALCLSDFVVKKTLRRPQIIEMIPA